MYRFKNICRNCTKRIFFTPKDNHNSIYPQLSNLLCRLGFWHLEMLYLFTRQIVPSVSPFNCFWHIYFTIKLVMAKSFIANWSLLCCHFGNQRTHYNGWFFIWWQLRWSLWGLDPLKLLLGTLQAPCGINGKLSRCLGKYYKTFLP